MEPTKTLMDVLEEIQCIASRVYRDALVFLRANLTNIPITWQAGDPSYVTYKGRRFRLSKFLIKYPQLFATPYCGTLNAGVNWDVYDPPALIRELCDEKWDDYEPDDQMQYDAIETIAGDLVKLVVDWVRSDNDSFEMVEYEGPDIEIAFDETQGAPHSCMTKMHGRSLAAGVPFYYQDGISVLVMYKRLENKGKVFCGRALIWKLDDGRIFMDRVYPSINSWMNLAFRKYAAKNGWLWRSDDTMGHRIIKQLKEGADYRAFTAESVDVDKPLVKSGLKNIAHNFFPYMDTMSLAHASWDGNQWDDIVLSNRNHKDDAGRSPLEMRREDCHSPFGHPCDDCGGYNARSIVSWDCSRDSGPIASSVFACETCRHSHYVDVDHAGNVRLAHTSDTVTILRRRYLRKYIRPDDFYVIGVGPGKGQLCRAQDAVIDYKGRPFLRHNMVVNRYGVVQNMMASDYEPDINPFRGFTPVVVDGQVRSVEALIEELI